MFMNAIARAEPQVPIATVSPDCNLNLQQRTADEVGLHVARSLVRYRSHGLQDLNKASLMNRVDTKFLVPVGRLPAMLDALQADFSALEIDGRRVFQYQSTYFDTLCCRFYNQHHNGQLNRHKVRLRTYVDSDLQFLEIKFKNNKGRTIKRRMQVQGSPECALDQARDFIIQAGVPEDLNLLPSLTNRYHRLALASEVRGERLTIDLNSHNQNHFKPDACAAFTGLAIIELKQARVDRSSPFFELVRANGLRSSGFSKYCMGMSATLHTFNLIRTNRFKRTLRRLDNLVE